MSAARWLPPANPERIYARLEKLEAREISGAAPKSLIRLETRRVSSLGEAWYAARDVCDALGMDSRKVLRLLPTAYRRTVTEDYGRYHKLQLTLVSREGVRTLIRLRGGLSLSEATRRLGVRPGEAR